MGMTFGIFGKGYASGYLGVPISSKDMRMGRIEDHPDALARAHFLGKKLVDDARARRKFLFQNSVGGFFMNHVLKPLMIRNVQVNKDGFLKAVHENLLGRGLIKT
jgi:hypothetical protein